MWRLVFFPSWSSQERNQCLLRWQSRWCEGQIPHLLFCIVMESGSGYPRCGFLVESLKIFVHLYVTRNLDTTNLSPISCFLRTIFSSLVSDLKWRPFVNDKRESFRNFFLVSHFFCHSLKLLPGDLTWLERDGKFPSGWFLCPRAQRKTLFWSD